MNSRKITIFCDQADSFFLEYLNEARLIVERKGDFYYFANNVSQINTGDILIAAAAKSILSAETLLKHKHNIVLHPSKLPTYRGSGVVAWSILEGANELWVTSFLASNDIDLGDIVLQSKRDLDGRELMEEIRHIQATLFLEHIDYVLNLKQIEGKPQDLRKVGKLYRRRTSKDSQLAVDKTIEEQFNLLRVVDNMRYPAFFEMYGEKYFLRITKE